MRIQGRSQYTFQPRGAVGPLTDGKRFGRTANFLFADCTERVRSERNSPPHQPNRRKSNDRLVPPKTSDLAGKRPSFLFALAVQLCLIVYSPAIFPCGSLQGSSRSRSRRSALR
jgi:hypothetical protein